MAIRFTPRVSNISAKTQLSKYNVLYIFFFFLNHTLSVNNSFNGSRHFGLGTTSTKAISGKIKIKNFETEVKNSERL